MTGKPRGKPFPKGVSGNPAGRTSPNRLTLEARRLAAEHGPKVVERICKDAANGDANAARLFMAFLLPRSKVTEPIAIDLPKLESASDVPAAIQSVLVMMAAGELTPTEGNAIIAGLEAFGRSSVFDAHEQRLQALEELLAGKEPT
jgi:hypothetical protein